jgi:glycosyltransferase involved in cell wall biosynthesis
MKISVVIPTYNYGTYLSRAIESVLAQTHPVHEIIVVDDGSTDDTRATAARFGERIRYIFQENRGLSAARNTGIRAATGEWVAFLDADDWWLPEKIQLQVAAADRDPQTGLVYTAAWTQTPDGAAGLVPATPPARIWPKLRYSNCVSNGSSAMVRRDALLAEGGFDELLTACEDWDMWVRLARKYRFAVVEAPVTMIAVWPQSMSSNHERMLANTEKIIDKTLLAGLRGWRRSLWRRRVWGAQLFGAAITARNLGPTDERRLLLRSLIQWPSPVFLPRRWAALFLNVIRAER